MELSTLTTPTESSSISSMTPREARDPLRTIPRALVVGLILSGILFVIFAYRGDGLVALLQRSRRVRKIKASGPQHACPVVFADTSIALTN
jgi:hypothetical protein